MKEAEWAKGGENSRKKVITVLYCVIQDKHGCEQMKGKLY